MDESQPRAKRQKKERPGRSAAFEKLKQLKGSKYKYEVDQIDDVYEVVDEKEYTKRVLNRQDEDWIVDDDGSGYIEDGRDIFDDDMDVQSIAAAVSSSKGNARKNKGVSKQAGKGNLQFLLSNMPGKKKEEAKLGDDDILSELISEIDNPCATHTPNRVTIKPKVPTNFIMSAEKRAATDYVKSFSTSKPLKKVTTTKESNELPIVSMQIPKATSQIQPLVEEDPLPVKHEEADESSPVIEEFHTQEEMFTDDLDFSEIGEFDSQEIAKQNQRNSVTEEQLLTGWETMQEGTCNMTQIDISIDSSKIPLVNNKDGNQVFRFFWWDAHENAIRRPGEVLLFGKTYCESAKAHVSCCVVVRNIERKIYLLPRTHELGANGESTEKVVALIDVYHEFNEKYAPLLTLQSFKSKKVTKNYCFDADVPTQSEYLEIKYPAKNPRLEPEVCINGGRTFSKVFGNRSSFLELFLLERKIKGPCWLDLSLPELSRNPMSYCKFEVNCATSMNVAIVSDIIPPPPLVVATMNVRTSVNSKSMNNEIVMMSLLVQTKYCVDKKPPNPLFEQHFCVFTRPHEQMLPFDIHDAITNFKSTRVQKMDSERALLNYYISQVARIDPDLIVGHDLQDYQINLLCDRLISNKATNFSRLGKIKRTDIPLKRILERELFVGRLVCDIKVLARELIRSRSYDLDTLCQNVLKLKEGERTEIEVEDVPKYFQMSNDLLRLITLTMQDSAYILKMMYELNAIPLALQITNIAGNVMSRTLLGGRSERNEFLLLHAFSERDYIVPEKNFGKAEENTKTERTSSKKKPTYSGGLVLDPKVGFYDKLILLMDFNSLYPSIIQEYNICFTTMVGISEDQNVLPDQNLPLGVLPTEIRKLVESRREVKKLMANPDLTSDLCMQYNIRQMALKLTANSMYGCLGFTNSRFFAKHLAALVTYKGREILTNTKDLVQKLCYEVIYGDTDSIMINTMCDDYDEVMKIGVRIKQEVNRMYKQVELDIDGVFKYLLLLKKKKYAAVTLTKNKNGEIKAQQEHKGLDIVRRDWSQLAAAAGRFTLDNILNDQALEERIQNIHNHLTKLKEDLEENKVPLSLLVITKQLTKDPTLYADKNQLPHVQVALRYNKKGGRLLRAGDVVPYVICTDGTNASATQRAYHIEELKNSEVLKIDVQYYLAQQIHPVVSRLCEPLEGTDTYQIAACLGLDSTSFKRPVNKNADTIGENIKSQNKFLNVEPFVFKCISCKTENTVKGALRDKVPFLSKCTNIECNVNPIDYLYLVQNQLTLRMREFIRKYYSNKMTCEDPACINETRRLPLRFAGKYPVCSYCKKGVMYKKYTESNLYTQLSYFRHIFDLSKLESPILLPANIEAGYHSLRENVERVLKNSGFAIINLTELYSSFLIRDRDSVKQEIVNMADEVYYDEEDDFDE